MIPKIIHYCWFGKNVIPDQYKEYMKSWRKQCPEYEIREWNEDSFDVTQNLYCKQAYEKKAWAFVSDYARLRIVYEHGGIYLDTDIELIRSLDELISDGVGYIGFQNMEQVNTGLGFAAEKGNPCVKKMLDIYENRSFIDDSGNRDMTPCPVANTYAMQLCGLKTGKKASGVIQHLDGITVYPVEYFNPKNVDTSKIIISVNTYSIHHYASSWFTDKQISKRKMKKIIPGFLLEIRNNYISRKGLKAFKDRYEGS